MFINRILRWLDGLIIMSQFGYTCSSSDALLLANDCSLMDELIPNCCMAECFTAAAFNSGHFYGFCLFRNSVTSFSTPRSATFQAYLAFIN